MHDAAEVVPETPIYAGMLPFARRDIPPAPLYLYVPLFTITTAREWVADGLVLITQLLYRSRLVKSLYIEVQVRYNLLFITNPENILIKLPRDLMVTFQGFPSW